MAKKKKRSGFGPRAFAGYAEYRYGSASAAYAPGKNPSLAGVLNGDKRRHVVHRVIDQLKQWRSSPFEFEGATRTGLRSGLFLAGTKWERADLVAADVIEDAFRQMGARRPTFEQGQPEYVDARVYCARCRKPLTEDQLSGNRGSLYCSHECAKAALNSEDMRQREKNDRFRRYAEGMVYRAKMADRICLECGAAFKPQSESTGQRFCSASCGASHRAREQAATGIPSTCGFCNKSFLAGNHKSRYCSDACRKAAKKVEAGHVPKLLKPHVFDHLFTVPVNEVIRLRMTPQKFDWMMMERGLRITGEARMPA